MQDIAKISIEAASPIEDIFLYNGKQVISVSTTGTMSQRVYDYVDRVEQLVSETRQVLPEEFSIIGFMTNQNMFRQSLLSLLKVFPWLRFLF